MPAVQRVMVAGAALALAGVVILMGIITAETQYPRTYTTHDNEISDLGATRPPDSVTFERPALLFNGTMIVSGALLVAAGGSLFARPRSRPVSVGVALMGVGVLGVGIFPGNNAAVHPLFALLTFVAGGCSGVLASRATRAPFAALSFALGAISLGALALGLFGSGTSLFETLGDGGVERWVAYPVVLWMVAFGGYLLREAEPLPARTA